MLISVRDVGIKLLKKKKKSIRIRDLSKPNLKMEVEKLIWAEHKYPKLVEELRSGSGTKEKVKG